MVISFQFSHAVSLIFSGRLPEEIGLANGRLNAGPTIGVVVSRDKMRWGSQRGYCVIAGQKVPLERPRVRDVSSVSRWQKEAFSLCTFSFLEFFSPRYSASSSAPREGQLSTFAHIPALHQFPRQMKVDISRP